MKDLTCPVMASLDLCIEIRRRVRLDPAVALHRLMQRFQVGDRVVSLPRFAHLFQSDSGVIIEVTGSFTALVQRVQTRISRQLDGKSVRVSIAGSVQLTEQQTHNLLAKFTFMKVLAFPLREFDRAFCKILETLIFDVIHISQPGGCLPLYRYRSGTRIPLTSKKGWRLAGRFSAMTNHFYSWEDRVILLF
ncbi:MAG: hypothetical protein DMG15_17790 [Acidobacteria bacterium]|nr:MAG: hypothetical protein DMG16_17025 [Acidobacteriota bacterium]PYS11441.1 MAG: hypothetical protein DMG15_17790 [Acidobacteriota bacterium]